MSLTLKRLLVCLALGFLAVSAVAGQTRRRPPAGSTPKPGQSKPKPVAPPPYLAKEPTLYVVGYAHLDTEWRWEYPQVIQEYLTKTMRNNFALFEKYPHYIFNFTGANRYRLMKEYYPADFDRLKFYVSM